MRVAVLAMVLAAGVARAAETPGEALAKAEAQLAKATAFVANCKAHVVGTTSNGSDRYAKGYNECYTADASKAALTDKVNRLRQ